MVYTQFNERIKMVHTDNGMGYFNLILADFLKNNGILHQSSCIDTSKQNGIAERKNHHLLEVARSFWFFANVPKYFWGGAVLTICYLINRLPTKILNFKTPLDFFSNLFPTCRNFSSLEPRVFGCVAFVHVPSQGHSKLDSRSHKMCFHRVFSHTKRI